MSLRRGWMSVGAVVLALVGCAPSAPPDPVPSTPGSSDLRVMTFNVLGAQADGVVYDEWSGWAARVDQLRPDVLVLQEVQSDDLGAIVQRTSTPYRVAAYGLWECDLKGNPEGVAIVVRSDLAVTAAGARSLGQSCADPSMKRVLAWADLDLGSGPLRVYGTHLTAGGGAAAASREAQIREIRATVAAEDPTDARRWLLAGDLNVTPGSFGYRLATGAVVADAAPYRFVDTFAELHPDAVDTAVCPTVGTDAVSMAALLADPQHVRDCGYTAGWPKDDNFLGCDVLSFCESWARRRDLSVRERIDFVLRAESGPVEVASTFVPNRADTDWASVGSEWFRLSDHLPYVVDLEVEGD